jgi:hypothetical protein
VFGWSAQFPKVQAWLNYLKRETEPDLWDSLTQTNTLSGVPHTRFTPEEQANILAQLDELTKHTAALNALTREQKELMATELRRIGAAVKSMDRGDWLRFAIGSMIAALLSGDFQQSLAASLMRWAVSAFHSMVTGSPAPPPFLPP